MNFVAMIGNLTRVVKMGKGDRMEDWIIVALQIS